MKKRILFLINPISGVGRQKAVEEAVIKEIDHTKNIVEIAYTQYQGHARLLSAEAAGLYNAVVAVGGDGTVNEVGSALVNSDTALAIVPTGSGNGLARFLELPLRINKAIQVINHHHLKKIDTLSMNEHISLNVAGIGFDAYISHRFADKKSRGPLGYLRLIPKEFAAYKSDTYRITIDDKSYEVPAFLISFANSSQWGNNVLIAPGAKIDDGLIDVCIINDFPKYNAPAYLYALLDQSLTQRPYDLIKKAKNIYIESDNDLVAHTDGEPVFVGKSASISIKPLSLNVVIPPASFKRNFLYEPLKEIMPLLPHLPQLPKRMLGNKDE